MNLRGFCESRLLSSFLSLLCLSAIALGAPLKPVNVTGDDALRLSIPFCPGLPWSEILSLIGQYALTFYPFSFQCSRDYKHRIHGRWIPPWLHFQRLPPFPPRVSSTSHWNPLFITPANSNTVSQSGRYAVSLNNLNQRCPCCEPTID